jgi:hypothetical protein
MQTMSTSSVTRAHSITSTSSLQKEINRSSFDFFNINGGSKANEAHPFGKELEQLDEVAEEFSGAVNDVERAADLQVMRQRGLVRFCATDYMAEIAPLFSGFGNHLSVPSMAWI